MPQTGRTMLTAGRMPDGSATGRGRHRQAAMTTLMRWRSKAMPQNDAAAMAESVITADIGASNDKAVTEAGGGGQTTAEDGSTGAAASHNG